MKESYTVIIPTMYFHKDKLQKLLDIFETCEYVKTVLVINNNKAEKCDFVSSKLRTLGVGVNMYVNASWRLGASLSTTENIILCNDDLELEGDLNELLRNAEDLEHIGMILGPDISCFSTSTSEIEVKEVKEISNGYGVFMIMNKNTFLYTYIPDGLNVWFGDNCLFNQNWTYAFSGFPIKTEHRGTSSRLNLQGVNAKERKIYERAFS